MNIKNGIRIFNCSIITPDSLTEHLDVLRRKSNDSPQATKSWRSFSNSRKSDAEEYIHFISKDKEFIKTENWFVEQLSLQIR